MNAATRPIRAPKLLRWAVWLAVPLLTLPVTAPRAATLSVVPGQLVAAPGETTSTLNIQFSGDGNTVGFEVELIFNDAELSLTGVSGEGGASCVLTAPGVLTAITVAPGLDPLPVTPATVCSFAVSVAPGAAFGIQPLSLQNALFSDASASPAPGPHTLNSGEIQIQPPGMAPILSSSPPPGSTLTLPVGEPGSQQSTALQFTALGGSGGVAATLNCVALGGIFITSGANQNILPGSTPAPVLIAGQLGESADSGTLQCTVNDANGVSSPTYSVALPAGQLPEGVGYLEDATAISAGSDYSCARRADASLVCWGGNEQGQRGTGDTDSRSIAESVLGLAEGILLGAPWVMSTSRAPQDLGGPHSCALRADGQLRCWGAAGAGQLSTAPLSNRLLPAEVQGLDGSVVEVAAGTEFSCARYADGGVACWGNNLSGRLGIGSADQSPLSRFAPTEVVGLPQPAVRVAAGGAFACALDSAGDVYCWGNNLFGSLGNGGGSDSNVPVQVALGGADVQTIAVGSLHACALTSGNQVRCWGLNESGQLGDGSTVNSPLPTTVSGMSGTLTKLAAGGEHSCALNSAGEVHCWGGNAHGQLGDGSTSSRSSPAQVFGLGTVTAISAGAGHTCALLDSGRVSCWGDNRRGQLGDGRLDSRSLVSAFDLVRRDLSAQTIDTPAPAAVDDATIAADSDASGRYVVFQSRASNLPITGKGRILDKGMGSFAIYRTDTLTGEIELVSIDMLGRKGAGDAVEPSVTANGQLVVFVAPDSAIPKVWGESPKAAAARAKGNGISVFLRNMLTGTTHAVPGAAASPVGTRPRVSASGNTVVVSLPSGPGGMNVFRVPLKPSPNPGTPGIDLLLPDPPECVTCKAFDGSGGITGIDSNGLSRNPSVSADGTFIIWETTARNQQPVGNVVCPDRSPAATDILLRNMLTGSVRRIGAPSNPSQCGSFAAGAAKPRLDYSGLNIVYESSQPLQPRSGAEVPDIWYENPLSGQRMRVSQGLDGSAANGPSAEPVISGDGSVVAFVSQGSNLDPEALDTNGRADLFVRSLRSERFRRLSRSAQAAQANGDAARPAINYSGSRLLFDSDASNLVPGSLGQPNVYLRPNPLDPNRLFGAGFE